METNQIHAHQIIYRLASALKTGNRQQIDRQIEKAGDIDWEELPDHLAKEYETLNEQACTFHLLDDLMLAVEEQEALEPFGPEWEKELMQMTKKEIIDELKKVCKENLANDPRYIVINRNDSIFNP